MHLLVRLTIIDAQAKATEYEICNLSRIIQIYDFREF